MAAHTDNMEIVWTKNISCDGVRDHMQPNRNNIYTLRISLSEMSM